MEMGCRNLDKRKVYIGVVLFYLAELIVFAVLVPMLSFVVVGVAPLVAGFLSHGAAVLLIYEFRVVSVCMNSEWVSSWVGARVAKRTQGFLDKAKGAMSTALLIGGSFLAYPLGPFLWALFLLLLAVLLFVFAPFLTYGVSEYPALQVALVGVTVSAVCLCACLSCPVWMLWWYTIFPCVYPVVSITRWLFLIVFFCFLFLLLLFLFFLLLFFFFFKLYIFSLRCSTCFTLPALILRSC